MDRMFPYAFNHETRVGLVIFSDDEFDYLYAVTADSDGQMDERMFIAGFKLYELRAAVQNRTRLPTPIF